MTAPYVVVLVHGRTGGRLPDGNFSGVGGSVEYQAALTTTGIDRVPTGPRFSTPKEAHRYAAQLERRLAKESVS